jgi:hypothetical protein
MEASEQGFAVGPHPAVKISQSASEQDGSQKPESPVGKVIDPRHGCGLTMQARAVDEIVAFVQDERSHYGDSVRRISVIAIKGYDGATAG